MDSKIIDKLIEIVGSDYVIYDKENVAAYLYDETEPKIRPKANEDCLVVKPKNSQEISEILKMANQALVTVVARGGGASFYQWKDLRKLLSLMKRILLLPLNPGLH
jgi:glycolate oxidase